jgi:hypothetical protein
MIEHCLRQLRQIGALSHKRSQGPRSLFWVSILFLWLPGLAAQTNVLYSTGFEPGEGFDNRFELIGQTNWTGVGTGGNGLAVDAFAGGGQQAFIGLFPPTDTNQVVAAWQPINYQPSNSATGIVVFSVRMRIVGSTNGNRDDFRWSIYNIDAASLFAVNFEDSTQQISYRLEDGGYVPTGFGYDHDGVYDLRIMMDFRRNLWTATLNDIVFINSKPISTQGSALNLGDVDAVWEIISANAPGDNYMLFDDYKVYVDPVDSIPPVLETPDVTAKGEFDFRVHGEQGVQYEIAVTEDFRQWFSLGEFIAPEGGSFDFRDLTAPDHPFSFYSVSQVP